MTFIAAANFSSVDIAATPVDRNKKLAVAQGCCYCKGVSKNE